MKKYGLGISLVILALAQVCTAALVADWNFDDSGNLGNDNAGAFNLSTTSGLVAPTYDAGGRVGGAASFIDDSEFVTPAGIYPAGDFTFAAWFNASDTNAANVVRSTSGRGGFQIYTAGGDWRARLFKQDTSYEYRIGPKIVADEWTHIAIYFNAASGPDANGNYTGNFRMWVDGVDFAGKDNVAYAAPASYSMHMGEKWGNYRGLMDEMKLYDHALSNAEIETLAAIPEPAALGLLIGGAALFFIRFRLII